DVVEEEVPYEAVSCPMEAWTRRNSREDVTGFLRDSWLRKVACSRHPSCMPTTTSPPSPPSPAESDRRHEELLRIASEPRDVALAQLELVRELDLPRALFLDHVRIRPLEEVLVRELGVDAADAGAHFLGALLQHFRELHEVDVVGQGHHGFERAGHGDGGTL